ncbi:hypothetical protein [Hydrogenovibrio kuenenii]|uniref:hypothetical protein n=1 Tax=Hydrogenovibrio kuenenii TaxID=63658 RepID=UPI000463B872|nr:hypothetical protein [Hydrogenovibrio kuenenii]
MRKKVTENTPIDELHQVFKLSKEDFEAKKARLFPIGNSELEVPTTSIFLASLSAVKEFRMELLSKIGVTKINAKSAQIHVYREIFSESKLDRPDGLIVITSGVRSPIIEWISFVEAKVGNNLVDSDQVERYLSYGNEIGVKNIITISNQMVTTPYDTPVVTKRTGFDLYHWSWSYIKVIASYLIRTDQVADEDHVYILSELRRYLDSHRNVSHFDDMGSEWKAAVGQIQHMREDEKISSRLLTSVVSAYTQEEKDLSLHLTDSSKYFIELRLTKSKARDDELSEMLNSYKCITSTYVIDYDRNSSFDIEVDFIRQAVNCVYKVEIDKGKAQAQTSKLLSILNGIAIADRILIKAVYPRNKVKLENPEVSVEQLSIEKEESELYSVLDKEIGDKVKYFELRTRKSLGARNFEGKRNFIVYLEEEAKTFVEQVIGAFYR